MIRTFYLDILLQIKFTQVYTGYRLIEINLECSKILSDYIVNYHSIFQIYQLVSKFYPIKIISFKL